MLAIFAPKAWDCLQPPYVRGESYGVGEVRCHCVSAASSLAPCLCRSEYVQCQAFLASKERTLLQSQRLEHDPFVSTQIQPGPTKSVFGAQGQMVPG